MRTKSYILFLLEVGAMASYFWNSCVYDRIAEKENTPFLFFLSYLGISVLIGSIFCFLIVLYSRFLALHTQMEKKALIWRLLVTFSPLLFLFLTLLEHVLFLRDIRSVLLIVSVLSCVYLHYCFWERQIKSSPQNSMLAQKWKIVQTRALHPKKASKMVLVFSISIYILYASGAIFPAHDLTGDEPHYLLITHSLLFDRDLNLFNNYKDKDYLQFYPGELESHGFPGKKGPGYEYAKHTPGLSVLLAPSYLVGTKLGRMVSNQTHDPNHQKKFLVFILNATMGLMAALLGWIFFLFARDFTKNQNAALLSWFVFTLTSPLLFYSHLIYPEIPASLLIIVILYRFLFSKNLTSWSFFWMGLGILFLPWLGVKYIVLSMGLIGIILTGLWKADTRRIKNILMFIAPLLFSSGFFLFYLWSLYGNILPSSIYKGYLSSGPSLSLELFHFKFNEFFRMGLGYLFDQSAGIFPYSPIYMIFILGVVLAFVRKKHQTLPLLGIFLLYWGFCSLFYYFGGYCPPGRALLPVTFILALFLAGAFAWGKNRYSIPIQRALLFLSLGISYLCAKDPNLLYHDFLSVYAPLHVTHSNLLNSLSNSIINFQLLVPSLAYPNQLIWVPLVFWMLVIVLFCLLFLKKEKPASPIQRDLKKSVCFVFLLSTLLTAYTFFDIHLDKAYHFENKPYQLYFQDVNNYGQELGGFWTRGQRASEVLVKTDARVSQISVKLSSPAPGKATIRVGREKRSAPRGRLEGKEKTLTFHNPAGFPLKDGFLYTVRIQEDRGFHPYRLNPEVVDNRFLGVFVEILVELESQ